MMATGIDDSEIEELCQGLPLVLKDQLKEAAMRLNFSLKHISVNENWNELLAIFRSECVGPWVKMMIDGQQQLAYVDSRDGESHIHEHDFKYSNLGPQLREFHEALVAIENFDPKKHDCEGVYRLAQSKNATHTRPNAQTREVKLAEIGAWLTNKQYRESNNKSALVYRATIHFKCGETDVRDAAREAKLTRPYKQSTK